ncbi:MAG TPA: PspC domain-containing protein [bacterium]|nr:PspC domain-containing protein [bacterium]
MNQTKKLYRSKKDQIIFGVCGGLAEYFEIDPLIVRLIFVALFFGGGAGLIIYLLFALLMPIKDSSKHNNVEELVIEVEDKTKKVSRGLSNNNFGFIIGAFLVILGISLLLINFWPFKFLVINFWPLLLILIGLIIIFKKK